MSTPPAIEQPRISVPQISEAIVILACEEHAALVEQILDDAGVLTWTQLPARQSRRQGYLQNLARREHRACCAFFAFGEATSIQRSAKELCRARNQAQLCAECVIVAWPAKQLGCTELALDPVCDEVVRKEDAAAVEYSGEMFFFCSPICRDQFLKQPDLYLQRRNEPYRVDRREIVKSSARGTFEGEENHDVLQEDSVPG